MKIATWNVNSLNVRKNHVCEWLQAAEPDVLVLQEIKQVNDAFDADAFAALGYRAVANGQKTYNGVATLARAELTDVATDIPGYDDAQRRVLAVTVDGLRIVNLYVPNGQSVGSDKYRYKLDWFSAVTNWMKGELTEHERLVVLGDFNVAPDDRDVYDPEKWGDDILCSPQEREALRGLMSLGLVDVFRQFEQPPATFSWWDYRAAGFRRNAGLRIDLILASEEMAERCTESSIDREPRTWERPSDHAPAVAEFRM